MARPCWRREGQHLRPCTCDPMHPISPASHSTLLVQRRRRTTPPSSSPPFLSLPLSFNFFFFREREQISISLSNGEGGEGSKLREPQMQISDFVDVGPTKISLLEFCGFFLTRYVLRVRHFRHGPGRGNGLAWSGIRLRTLETTTAKCLNL